MTYIDAYAIFQQMTALLSDSSVYELVQEVQQGYQIVTLRCKAASTNLMSMTAFDYDRFSKAA